MFRKIVHWHKENIINIINYPDPVWARISMVRRKRKQKRYCKRLTCRLWGGCTEKKKEHKTIDWSAKFVWFREENKNTVKRVVYANERARRSLLRGSNNNILIVLVREKKKKTRTETTRIRGSCTIEHICFDKLRACRTIAIRWGSYSAQLVLRQRSRSGHGQKLELSP